MNSKIVEGFFNELIKVRDNNKLSCLTILNIIEKSLFDEETKEILKERINSHNECEINFLNDEENEDNQTPFVVTNYGNVNTSLECECCYSVIIDDEVLEMMV